MPPTTTPPTAPAPGLPPGLPRGPGWRYQVDWAGIRLRADVDEGALALRTLDGRDVTTRFPEFAGLTAVVADGLLDAEAVLLEGGVPSVLGLGERLRTVEPRRARALARRRPAVLLVHDVLRLYGVDLVARPFDGRRAVLDRLDLAAVGQVQVSPCFDDGAALLAAVAAHGLSGVVARRGDRSGAEPGGAEVRVPVGGPASCRES